jgi:DNA-directed RNA polymerase alpha subunit
LAPRTKHLLEKYGVNTVADLCYFRDYEILDFRGVGPTTVEEIDSVTQTYNKQLLNEYSQEDIDTALKRVRRTSEKQVYESITEQQRESSLELPFSVRINRSLIRGGIRSLADLVSASEETIRRTRNIGEKSLLEILNPRNQYILTLGSDPSFFNHPDRLAPDSYKKTDSCRN